MSIQELIKAKIENDLRNLEDIGKDTANWVMSKHDVRTDYLHGLALRGIVEPRLEEYKDSWNNDSPIMLWTVFEEPGDGYAIVYSEESGEFGLATNNKIFLHFDGSFGQTLYGM